MCNASPHIGERSESPDELARYKKRRHMTVKLVNAARYLDKHTSNSLESAQTRWAHTPTARDSPTRRFLCCVALLQLTEVRQNIDKVRYVIAQNTPVEDLSSSERASLRTRSPNGMTRCLLCGVGHWGRSTPPKLSVYAEGTSNSVGARSDIS